MAAMVAADPETEAPKSGIGRPLIGPGRASTPPILDLGILIEDGDGAA